MKQSHHKLNNRLKLIISALVSLWTIRSAGQKIYNYNAPGNDCYCEMIFDGKATDPRGVIVIDVKGADISKYSQNNPYYKSGLFKNYNFLYLNILNKGGSKPMSCYDVVIRTISGVNRVYVSSFFLIMPQQKNIPMIIKKTNEENYSFNIIYDNNSDEVTLLSSLDSLTKKQFYRVPINVSNNNQQEYENRMLNYKRNFDVGIYLAPAFLNGSKLGLSKGAVTSYGLSFAKNIGTQFALKATIGGSFKKPNQSAIQSGLQSKIQSAAKAGDSTVYINETLSGHVIYGADISLKYYFEKTKPLRAFISAGTGWYITTNISGSIQDTIGISGIDPSNPSSMQSALGGSVGTSASTPAGMSNNITKYIVPQVEAGFEYRLSPVAKLNVSVPFKYFFDKSSTNNSTFTFGLNLGLSFTMNPGKFPRKLKLKNAN